MNSGQATPLSGEMMLRSVAGLIARDLRALRREVEAYPTDEALWMTVPGAPNSGGALVRHLCGNLQHFIGALLGETGYLRNREAEFRGPPETRPALLAEIDRTRDAIETTLARLDRPGGLPSAPARRQHRHRQRHGHPGNGDRHPGLKERRVSP